MSRDSSSQSLCATYCGWTLFFCGICMGTADLIPGISGGTIAFILGFYHPLLESLKTLNAKNFELLFKGRWKEFGQKVNWKFLATLFSGVLCAFVCFANLLHVILADEIHRTYLYATFFGLILSSFVFCVRQVQTWNKQAIFGLLLGALIAYFLTDTTLSTVEGNYAIAIEVEAKNVPVRNYDPQEKLLTGLSSQMLGVLLAQGLLQDNSPVYNQQSVLIGLAGELVPHYHVSFFNGWLVLCGALAVCALLLPGISGSYILTLLGVYPLVIESLADFIKGMTQGAFHLDAFSVLWSLGLGIVLGAIAFARIASQLLLYYPNQSLAILSGFMIGAMRSVWPFWSYEYVVMPLKIYKGPQLVALHPFFPSWDSPLVWQAGLCMVIGFAVVFVLELYMEKKQQKV